jgi:hypothetical protein
MNTILCIFLLCLGVAYGNNYQLSMYNDLCDSSPILVLQMSLNTCYNYKEDAFIMLGQSTSGEFYVGTGPNMQNCESTNTTNIHYFGICVLLYNGLSVSVEYGHPTAELAYYDQQNCEGEQLYNFSIMLDYCVYEYGANTMVQYSDNVYTVCDYADDNCNNATSCTKLSSNACSAGESNYSIMITPPPQSYTLSYYNTNNCTQTPYFSIVVNVGYCQEGNEQEFQLLQTGPSSFKVCHFLGACRGTPLLCNELQLDYCSDEGTWSLILTPNNSTMAGF